MGIRAARSPPIRPIRPAKTMPVVRMAGVNRKEKATSLKLWVWAGLSGNEGAVDS